MDTVSLPHNRPLTRSDAAAYVTNTFGMPCSPNTLAKLAVVGGGPVFRKAGLFTLYDPSDLDAWVRAKLGPRVRSTSEMREAA